VTSDIGLWSLMDGRSGTGPSPFEERDSASSSSRQWGLQGRTCFGSMSTIDDDYKKRKTRQQAANTINRDYKQATILPCRKLMRIVLSCRH
jgi:hypothetical protein